MSEEEINCLIRYAALSKKAAVEIGTFKGGSACYISKALPESVPLFTLDPYISDSMIPEYRGNWLTAFLNILFYGRIKQVHLIKGYSFNISRSWSTSIDFLFIDGDHRYEKIKKDFEEWSHFLVSGGFILFHDSNRKDLSNDDFFDGYGWTGPTQLCSEIKKEQSSAFDHIESVCTLNIFRKK